MSIASLPAYIHRYKLLLSLLYWANAALCSKGMQLPALKGRERKKIILALFLVRARQVIPPHARGVGLLACQGLISFRPGKKKSRESRKGQRNALLWCCTSLYVDMVSFRKATILRPKPWTGFCEPVLSLLHRSGGYTAWNAKWTEANLSLLGSRFVGTVLTSRKL